MPPDATPNNALPPIHTAGGQRVMLDRDLAQLYEVPTMVFNQAIKRNLARFPSDFIFQPTREKLGNLKSQIVTSSSAGPQALRSQIVTLKNHGGRSYLPFVFCA
jgi:hypothetical protein